MEKSKQKNNYGVAEGFDGQRSYSTAGKNDFTTDKLRYMVSFLLINFSNQTGFGNMFSTECLEDALPRDMNNPQKCAYDLYAEQLSGTPFTYPRVKNQFT